MTTTERTTALADDGWKERISSTLRAALDDFKTPGILALDGTLSDFLTARLVAAFDPPVSDTTAGDEADAIGVVNQAHPAPEPVEGIREKVALDWLAANPTCELDFGYDDADEGDPGCWRVHRVNGGRNDREWTLIGQGATPTDAILSLQSGERS